MPGVIGLSRRSDRISDLLREEISKIISNQLKDPRINGLVSITQVDVSPDLRLARAYVSIFGNSSEKKLALEGLTSSSGFLRRQLGSTLGFRRIPEIQFILDDSMEHGNNLLTIIDNLRPENFGKPDLDQ
jgi:ribosome-binding factor A